MKVRKVFTKVQGVSRLARGHFNNFYMINADLSRK